MEKRLGRGLGSLLGPSEADVAKKPTLEVEVGRVRPNPFQPRREFDPSTLDELAQSIRRHGVLQPVAVRQVPGGYELISGERRLRASKLAGRATIPAVVLEVASEREMLELALVENVQRQDLNAIERAEGFKRMRDELGLTQEGIAERVGLKRATVTNHLRLLDLPDRVQEAVARGLITMGHARALLTVPSHSEQERWMARVVRDDLSVRQVEQLVRVVPRPEAPKSAEPGDLLPQGAWIVSLEERLRQALGTKVELKNGPGFRGQITISYFGREDLERLADRLAPKGELR